VLSAAYPSEQRVLGGADGDVQQLFEFSRRLDPLMPFDAKHAAQHASLVGEQLLAQRVVLFLGPLSLVPMTSVSGSAAFFTGGPMGLVPGAWWR
jgi:hypothetical protein